MGTVAVYPGDCSAGLQDALALSGQSFEFVGDQDLDKPEAASAWSLLIVELGEQPLRRLRLVRRVYEDSGVPILIAAMTDHLAALDGEPSLSDFTVAPFEPNELKMRIRRLVSTESDGDLMTYRDLELNTATYQATTDGVPIDLTYMEYELLRFFMANQGRVWSREQLLSKVWGYEYFGGARTVDVHVRRLRAKIGEERAGWITTIRSVGYRFG